MRASKAFRGICTESKGNPVLSMREMHVRVLVAAKADEANFALFLGFLQGFGRTAGTNEELGIILKNDAVNLPEVEVVGLVSPQRLFEHLHGKPSVATVGADLGH